MNDNATYTSLGFQVLLILNRLRTHMQLRSPSSEEHQEESHREAARECTDKDDPEDKPDSAEKPSGDPIEDKKLARLRARVGESN